MSNTKEQKDQKLGGRTRTLTKTDLFKQAIQGPCFVKVGATWCRPCKQFKPTYQAIANVNSKIKFLDIDADNDSDVLDYIRSLPSAFPTETGKIEVKTVPAILLFLKGKHRATTKSNESAMAKDALEHFGITLSLPKQQDK